MGFPRDGDLCVFSLVAPVQDSCTWGRGELEHPEKWDPRPRESCTRQDSCPQSATKPPVAWTVILVPGMDWKPGKSCLNALSA